MFNPNNPFELPNLPPKLDLQNHPDFMRIMNIHNNAQKNISELNGSLREIENPELLLSSFYLHESIDSSAVENIHTTIESALEDETKPEQERSDANKEVINYRKAIKAGHDYLNQYGLSSRTIKNIHRALEVKKGIPGEYRTIQNNLANKRIDGSKIVIYTPPKVSNLNALLSNWETFADKDKSIFPLIKAAICHYQFEAIHPFEDGNGRTGRILMVLQLMMEEMLDYPVLFISSYLSENEDKYKELLLNVTNNGEWWEFIEFMLIGFSNQALNTRISLLKLKNARKELITDLYKNENVKIRKTSIKDVVNHIFYYPTTHPKFMGEATKIHWQTCSKYLGELAKMGILKEAKIGRYKFYRNLKALSSLIVD